MPEQHFFAAERLDLLWPLFFGGLGFALASVLIAVAYIVHSLRRAATNGNISKWLSEAIIIFLFLPGIASIFAIITALRFAREKGIEDEYLAFVISFLVSIGVSLYGYWNKVYFDTPNKED